MKKINLLILLLFNQISFGQEFLNDLQRAEELPVKKSELKNILKIEDAVYLTSFGETNLMAVREYQFSNGILQSVKTYDSKKVVTSEENYFYDDNNELIKVTEFIPLDFIEKKHSETKIITKRNKQNQIVEIKFVDTSDDNVSRIKKFKPYWNKDSDYVLEETSIIDYGENINDKDATSKMKFTYKNGSKTLYQNLDTKNEISYEYDTDGILTKKEGKEFIDEKDAKGNIIKRILNATMMVQSNFYKITYADGTVSGDLNFDKTFFEKSKRKK